MRIPKAWRRGIALVLLLPAGMLAGASLRAQSADPDAERARELVRRIRSSMRDIDALLLKGAQPKQIETELVANQKRIEDLLRETESKSQSVVQNIDELVKLMQAKAG